MCLVELASADNHLYRVFSIYHYNFKYCICIWEMKHPVRIAHVKNCYRKCIDSVQRQFIQYAFYPNQLQAGGILKRTCKSHE